MSQFLLYYQRPEPTTWVYLSSFLTIGLYFVFHRFWSVRNLDILLLILLAPGLLMVNEGRRRQLAAGSDVSATSLAAAAETEEDSPADRLAGSFLTGRGLVDDEFPGDRLRDDEAAGSGSARHSRALADADPQGLAEADGFADAGGPLRGETIERRGFLWLFGIELLILVRLLLDPMMVRRPLLDPNLTTGGLVFIGVSMLIFLMTNVVTSTPQMQREQGPQLGPGYPVLNMLPAIPTTPESQPLRDRTSSLQDPTPPVAYAALARTLAILAHVAVVVGITMIGHRHFGNFKAGAGCATLYLMLPYTAQMTGRVDHVLPAALLVWAVLMYRRPAVAGICLGSAAGLVYYPLFLLPLWISFYRRRGLARFSGGFAITLLVLTVLLSLGGSEQLVDRLRQMFGLWVPWRWSGENLEGLWGLGWSPIWRLPVLVAFVLLSGLYAVWPGQKNLGSLMSCSAALMVAAQFWHGFGGGLYVAWFLPLMLLTIFRPNLEDRVALKVLGSSSSVRRPLAAGVDIDAA